MIQEFDRLFKELGSSLGQERWEFFNFLKFCRDYFDEKGVFNPIVLEIGAAKGVQKDFYTLLLKANYISIDIDLRAKATIYGDSKSPETVAKVKEFLAGKPIDLLFIDGDHRFESVKKDFELYEPLTRYIIALHDIAYLRTGEVEVKLFWEKLLNDKRFYFLAFISNQGIPNWPYPIGTGVAIKK